jgi:hypothetical protein
MYVPALAFLLVGIALGTASTWLATVSAGPRLQCQASARQLARLELLFGTSRSHRLPVAEEEWTRFLDTEVTPRFPAGLTVLRGPGQWRGNDGRPAKEQSNMLVICHEPTAQANTDIEAIRTAYKKRFDQESVMRVDGMSCVSF